MKVCVLLLRGVLFAVAQMIIASVAFALPTGKIQLDGQWDFSAVNADGSIAQTGKIKVPGAWDAQGYGNPTDKVKSNFVGVGLYAREVELPDGLDDFDVRLVMEGVSRYARVWINGEYAGEGIGLGSHRLNVGKFVRPGANKIKIEVDSRQRHSFDQMLGAAQLNDYMEVAWGGLYGHVYFEIMPKVRLEDFYVRSRILPARFIAEARVIEPIDKKKSSFWDSGKKTGDSPYSIGLEVFDARGKLVAKALKKTLGCRGSVQRVEAEVANAKLWTPDTPYLYRLKMSLFDGQGNELHCIEWRAGIKEVKVRKTNILLNGKPVFLRGYGDDHVYVKEFSMPADKAMYVERLRKIKALGFNHVRLHSTIMPPEYYEACDEVGMMPNAEFQIGYPCQIPPSRWWLERAPHGSGVSASYDFFCRRFRQSVVDFRNYTCIFAWVGGNEFFMGPDKADRNADLFKRMQRIVWECDPDRIFMDCDGDFAAEILKAENDRSTLDMYSVLFDEWCDFCDFGKKYSIAKPKKPVIAHEMANFCTFGRPSVADGFKESVFKPFWMQSGLQRLKEQDRLGEADNWADASEALILRLHKHNVESLRLQKYIVGYHWWLIQDYWTSSDGIFDHNFVQKKNFKTQDILKFNAPTVILQDGLKFAYADGEAVSAKIFVSNFSGAPFGAGIEAVLKSGGKELVKLDIAAPARPVENAEVALFAQVNGLEKYLDFNGEQPRQYELCVSSVHEGKRLENDWRFSVFPAKSVPEGLKFYADAVSAKSIPSYWNAQARGSAKGLGAGDVFFGSRLNEDAVDAMQNGAIVVLVSPKNAFKGFRMNYKSSWWRAGSSDHTNCTGNYVSADSPLAPIAPQRYCAEAMANLLHEGRRYLLDGFENQPEITVRAIPSLMLVRDYACVFRARVGKGMLVVSGFSHEAQRQTPENAWCLSALLKNRPKQEWSADFLRTLID